MKVPKAFNETPKYIKVYDWSSSWELKKNRI